MATAEPEIKHHLDRRVGRILADGTGSDDDLLTCAELANWFGVSRVWVDQGRTHKYGPPYIRITPRAIRYRRADVLKWLKARRFSDTSEYVR
jgi:predicted DNA-binding transcriptional regulator AlpA